MTHSNSGALLMGLAAAAALALCIYNYVTPFTGIDGTPGALLVIVSTAILIGFAVDFADGPWRRGRPSRVYSCREPARYRGHGLCRIAA